MCFLTFSSLNLITEDRGQETIFFVTGLIVNILVFKNLFDLPNLTTETQKQPGHYINEQTWLHFNEIS